MEATITTLQGVLKSKLSNEIESPTVWADLEGAEHVESGITILSADPGTFKLLDKDSNDNYLCINGTIKRVGSTVVQCGPLVSIAGSTKQYPYDLGETFKYARSLECLYSTFRQIDSKECPLEIPEDLFWNCPDLKLLDRAFSFTWIKSIPARLFEQCTKLRSLLYAFAACPDLKVLPADLFKNNSEIRTLEYCFSYSGILNPPKDLLEPLVELSKRRFIEFNKMFFMTPISKDLKNAHYTEKKSVLTRLKKLYFPDKFSFDTVYNMLDGIALEFPIF